MYLKKSAIMKYLQIWFIGFIQSVNQIKTRSIQSIYKSIQINLINQLRLWFRLAHHRTALRYFLDAIASPSRQWVGHW